MSFIEILLIAIGLAMDSFAVSVCKGLSVKNIRLKDVISIALGFGIFQALMPIIGFFLGKTFHGIIESVDHWVAFILLSIIGGNMIRESFDGGEKLDDKIDFKEIILLSIATSIDALAVGLTFAFFEVNLISAVSVIGIIAFCLSFIGVYIGKKFGDKFESKAELTGGGILVLIGLKILFEHSGIFALIF